MEIRIDGSRSSAENWMQAQIISNQFLPELSDAQKVVADKMGISHEGYARSLYAGDLGRKELEGKAERIARLVEQVAQQKVPGIKVAAVWLKTLDGKFRFDCNLDRSHSFILMDEDLLDELLESGSKAAEEQIVRIIEHSLPASWMMKAS